MWNHHVFVVQGHWICFSSLRHFHCGVRSNRDGSGKIVWKTKVHADLCLWVFVWCETLSSQSCSCLRRNNLDSENFGQFFLQVTKGTSCGWLCKLILNLVSSDNVEPDDEHFFSDSDTLLLLGRTSVSTRWTRFCLGWGSSRCTCGNQSSGLWSPCSEGT